MITLTSTPTGLRLARGADAYTATDPAALAVIITRLIVPPATAPASAPVAAAPRSVPATPGRLLGQRLALARRRYL